MKTSYSIKDFLHVKAAWAPSFSPDGSTVAFLSNDTGSGQLYTVPVKGGEPTQLTHYADAVTFARFSPTENKIIFGKSEGGNEQTQLLLLNLETQETIDITNQSVVKHDFGGWSPDGKSICFTSTERNGTDFDAYILNIETGEKRCIFDQGGWCGALGFSPLGTYVIVGRSRSNADGDLYLCNVNTGTVDHITPHTGAVQYSTPCWLPDETAFYLIKNEAREYRAVCMYAIANRHFEYILTPDWDVDGMAVDRYGNAIAVLVNEDGYHTAIVYEQKSLTRYSNPLPKGNVSSACFSVQGNRLALVVGDSTHTTDVWIVDLDDGVSWQLTHSVQGVPAEVMVEPELVHYLSFDGVPIPAFIYRPRTVPPGKKLPVVINIHGGPEAQYLPVMAPITQYLVHCGYIVVGPNVRGSSGYGKTFMSLDDVEKRMDSVKDIVSLREYLAQDAQIDVEKIALMGGSYGGFMVLAGLTFYPALWAAGVNIVGIGNFVTFLENTASYRRSMREAEYGSLIHHREFLEHISPYNFAENIQAPLMVIHGANDPRVPLSEAEQIVEKLTALGRDVELLVYADEGHGLAKLQNKLDAYPKMVAFLERVLI